jgi:hypothetical protein
MSEEETPEPTEPPTDERWLRLSEFVRAAFDMGRPDLLELHDLVNLTENEELRATADTLVDAVMKIILDLRENHERLKQIVGGRESIAGEQLKTELALLERIQEASKATQDPQDLYTLAITYGELRSASVAPGWYDPDRRHSGTDGTSTD